MTTTVLLELNRLIFFPWKAAANAFAMVVSTKLMKL
eukprot:CAMPEP_0183448762 /NCGR_PEP_ID=MMETSP0370-20130417/107445_1 /TAXON_ID=268820 /ORGANISM="Peridinium aciculiferum, Strain PAER-2" /LENGTH=35 /DNA_ID= /DNA_START= /DNA_END= /DNA_ORIENTATION=